MGKTLLWSVSRGFYWGDSSEAGKPSLPAPATKQVTVNGSTYTVPSNANNSTQNNSTTTGVNKKTTSSNPFQGVIDAVGGVYDSITSGIGNISQGRLPWENVPSTTPPPSSYVGADPKAIEDEQKRLDELKQEQEKKLRQYERQIKNQERKYQSSIAGMLGNVNELKASAPYDLQTTMWQGHPLTVRVDKKYWIDVDKDTVKDANELFNKDQAVLQMTSAYKKMQSDYANWDSNAWESYEDYEDDVSSNVSSINKAIADMETYQSQGMGMYVKDDTYYFFSPSSRDVATWLELSPSERPKYLSYVSGTSMVNWNAMGLSKERIYGTGTTAWGFFTPWEWGKQLGASGMADFKAMELNVFTDFWGMTGNLIQAPFSSKEQNALRAVDWEKHGYDVLLSTSEPRKGEKANDYYGRILSSEPAKQLMSWGLSFGVSAATSYASTRWVNQWATKTIQNVAAAHPKVNDLMEAASIFKQTHPILSEVVPKYGVKYGTYLFMPGPEKTTTGKLKWTNEAMRLWDVAKGPKSYNTFTEFTRGLGNFETRWAFMESGWEYGKKLGLKAGLKAELDKTLKNKMDELRAEEKRQAQEYYRTHQEEEPDWMHPEEPKPPTEGKEYYFSEDYLEEGEWKTAQDYEREAAKKLFDKKWATGEPMSVEEFAYLRSKMGELYIGDYTPKGALGVTAPEDWVARQVSKGRLPADALDVLQNKDYYGTYIGLDLEQSSEGLKDTLTHELVHHDFYPYLSENQTYFLEDDVIGFTADKGLVLSDEPLVYIFGNGLPEKYIVETQGRGIEAFTKEFGIFSQPMAQEVFYETLPLIAETELGLNKGFQLTFETMEGMENQFTIALQSKQGILQKALLNMPLSASRTESLFGSMPKKSWNLKDRSITNIELSGLGFEELVGQIQEPIQDTIEEQEQDIITPTETTPTEDYFDWNETIPNIPFFVIKKLPEEEEEKKKELYTKKHGKKSLLLKKKKGEKGLLSDLLSVTRSQALYGTATHPRLTKKVWAESEKSLFKTVPTVELRKKGRQFRNLVGSGNVSLSLGESGKKNLMGESKMNNLFGKKTKGGRKNAYY